MVNDTGFIPQDLLCLLKKSPVWDDSGTIRLTPKWAPLQDVARQAEKKTGIYALGVPCGIGYEGGQLFRPVLFHNQPKTKNAVKTPLLCVGQCREEFAGKPVSLSGGPLEFEAYLFWTPKVLPSQHQGVMIRVGNASGAPFDRTFMGYQVSEQTRLQQITAEIFVREGLDGAINLDRESFNYAHPHYQFLVKWLPAIPGLLGPFDR